MKIATLILCLLCLRLPCEAAEVKTVPITGEKFVAELHDPGKASTKPAVLFLGGSEGGIPRAHPYLAENGYPVLAVAYFKHEILPGTLQLVPLEYFDSPIQWLQKDSRTAGRKIVVIGASKGAELGLLLASRKPEIKGVVAISGSSVVWDGIPRSFWPPQPKSSWSEGDKPIPFVPYDYSVPFNPTDPKAIFKFYERSLKQTNAVEKARIPVERIQGPILLVSGTDDQLWPSSQMAEDICEQLKKSQFPYAYKHVKYSEAGHTLSETYMIGGTVEGNRKARLDLKDKLLGFLQEVGTNGTGRAK